MEKEIITNPNYWDCECQRNYIHSINIKECPICKTLMEDGPESRQNEIDEFNQLNISSSIEKDVTEIIIISGNSPQVDKQIEDKIKNDFVEGE